MLKGKKADASMIILVVIILFFLAVSFLVVNFVGIKFQWIMDNTVLNSTDAAPEISSSMNKVTTSTMDNGFLMIISFIVIGIIVSSFLIRIHPVWLFLYIIFLGVGVFLGVFLGNAYQSIIDVAVLSDAVSNMPKTVWMMKNSLKIILATGAISMIVIFSKIFGREGYVERV